MNRRGAFSIYADTEGDKGRIMKEALSIREIPQYALKYLLRTARGGNIPERFSEAESRKVLQFHRKLPGYEPTPLVRLRNLAQSWGIGEILIKDESARFNLRAFKVLGGSCADFVAANGIRILANPLGSDDALESGESGSVGIGLLDLLANNPDWAELKTALKIGPESRLLFFNTEGATDPENYRDILWHGKYPLPEI